MPSPSREIHQPKIGPRHMMATTSAHQNGQILCGGKKPTGPAPSITSASFSSEGRGLIFLAMTWT